LLDLNRVVSSRDVGVRADGPIPVGREGLLRYGFMVGNNEGVFPEEDRQKRLYAQVQAFPTEALRAAVGVTVADYADERTDERALFGVLGYVTDAWRVGVEGYLHDVGYDGAPHLSGVGVSVFGAVSLMESLEAVARFDRASAEAFAEDGRPVPDSPVDTAYTTLALVGLSYAPIPALHLTPNLRWARTDGLDEADFLARFTVDFSF
ncbi:MAG TPA: hypothetical protein VD838_01275, partial [Anaeromyxobacteraceae bacterium]|nr:hypothetical protein [Anaeromyxobacteraceae bacterium]